MIRRAILVAAAAVLLILTPSAAMAYEAPGYNGSVSDSTPAVGQSITVTIDGGAANANQVITLSVTGPRTKSFTATTNGNGVVRFTFSLGATGVYTLTATDASGAVVNIQKVTVHAVNAGGVVTGGGQLSYTGTNALPLAAGGGLLVLAGVGAVLVARRRKTTQVAA